MPLRPGASFGAFDVVELIGAGGMGEVYRARDTRLGRDVALKVLPSAFALDPDRLARFRREAQVLASVGHPGIAGIFGLEQSADGPALVLELVEGPTLAERIDRGPLPADEALPLARQIAEALEVAHEHGIVHRDLKPANIKVRPDGVVKVLDFGLARPHRSEPDGAAGAEAPTITSPAMTQLGVILGTAAYMSPEQARGGLVDKRSDIWAFGCVLFEMLTGVRAFQADSVTDTLAAIVRSEPEWQRLPGDVPPAIRRLLKRCLDKDVRRRLRDVGEARIALENEIAGTSEGVTTAGGPLRLSRRVWALIAGLSAAAAAATAALLWLLLRPAAGPVVRLAVLPPPDAPLFTHSLAITPDGRHIVYVSGNGSQLSVRALHDLAPRHLTDLGAPFAPFVSPDGQQIGFFDSVNALKVMPITGGPAVTVCALRGAAGRGASWLPDGTIVFATDDPATGLWRVSDRGGTPEAITTPKGEFGDHLWPHVLPGARAALVTVGRPRAQGGSTSSVGIVNLETGELTTLFPGAGARYVPSGHLIYAAAGALRGIAFDLDRLETYGTPVSLVEEIAGAEATSSTLASAVGAAVAADGTLVYVTGGTGQVRRLVWVDRLRQEEAIPAPPRGYVIPRVSPDGSRLALDVRDGTGADIWTWDFARKTMTRLTFGTSVYPVWTPDGARIVHTTFDEARVGRLFLRPADGSTRSEQLTEGPSSRYAGTFTTDRASLLFREEAGDSGLDIGMVSLGQERRLATVLRTPSNELNPELSPDGRWLAYESNESGQNEIYVRPYPDVAAGLWQISTTGGRQPAWNPAGGELFFRAQDGAIMSVAVEAEPRFAAGVPARVVDGPYYIGGPYRSYDIARDGRRFVLIRTESPAGPAPAPSIVVVQNWFEELRRLLPTSD